MIRVRAVTNGQTLIYVFSDAAEYVVDPRDGSLAIFGQDITLPPVATFARENWQYVVNLTRTSVSESEPCDS